MAHKLQDFFPVRRIKGGIEVLCEINTQHMVKEYYLIEARGAHINAQEGYGETSMAERPPMVQMKVCIICMHEYNAYIHNKIGEYESTIPK
jgi:hypothetical protein